MSGRHLSQLVHEGTPEDLQDRLIIEYTARIVIEQHVDLPAYFAAFSEGTRKHYLDWATENENGYADYELPVAFLSGEVWENTEVVSPLSHRVSDTERVDMDDVDTRVRTRAGQHSLSRWGDTDFALIRRLVPWLDATHRVLEGLNDGEPAEEDIANLARIPGPQDTPLFGGST